MPPKVVIESRKYIIISAVDTGDYDQQSDDLTFLHVCIGYFFYHGCVATDDEILIASDEEGLGSPNITSLVPMRP